MNTAPLADLRCLDELTIRRPMLANPQTQVTLCPCEGGEELEAIINVYNAGSAPACDVVLRIPLPEGFACVEAIDGLVERRFELLEPEQAAVVRLRLRVVAPLPSNVVALCGVRVASTTSGEHVLDAATTELACDEPFGERSELSVDGSAEIDAGTSRTFRLRLCNERNLAASNVVARLVFPEALQYAAGSARCNGSPLAQRAGRPARRGRRLTDRKNRVDDVVPEIRVEMLGGGSVVVLEVQAYAIPGSDDESAVVCAEATWGDGRIRRFELPVTLRASAAFLPETNRVVLLGPAAVNAASSIRFALCLQNDGAAPAHDLRLSVDAPSLERLEVDAGESPQLRVDRKSGSVAIGRLDPRQRCRIEVAAHVPAEAADGTPVRIAARLFAGEHEVAQLAPAEIRVVAYPIVRADACAFELLDPEPLHPKARATVRIRARNDGTDAARSARIAFTLPRGLALCDIEGASLEIGDVPPQRTVDVTAAVTPVFPAQGTVPLHACVCADNLLPTPLDPVWIDVRADADFSAALSMECDACPIAGEAVAFVLCAENTGDGIARRLTIAATPSDAFVYLCGTTTINGIPIVEERGRGAFHRDGGLVLHDVEPGTRIEVRWSAYACAGEDAFTEARLAWDEKVVVVRSATCKVLDPSGTCAADLPFRVDATFRRAAEPEPVAPVRDWLFALPCDRETRSAIVAFLEQTEYGALVTHVLTLRALFPSSTLAGDEVDPRVRACREALRSVLDRLAIKLRIPNFQLAGRDLEDGRARAALLDLTKAFCAPAPVRTLPADHLCARLDAGAATALSATLERAPLGGARTFSVLALFIPTESATDPDAARALRVYRDELCVVFDGYAHLAPEVFHAALREPSPRGLDAARRGVVAAIAAERVS